MATSKPQFTSDFQEFDTHDANAKSAKITRAVDSVRLGLTLLALLSSISVLGMAGDTLANFNRTTLGADYILSLWPNEFDLRPTTALVICSAIVLVVSAISLVASSVSVVSIWISVTGALSNIESSRYETEPSSTMRSHLSHPQSP